MTRIDGHSYGKHGLGGMLAVDALSSLAVGTLLLLVFRRMGLGRGGGRTAELEPTVAGSE